MTAQEAADQPDLVAAIKEFLAAGRLDDALVALRATPDPVLVSAGLLGQAKFYRDARFIEGEVHLAPIIQTQFRDQPAEFLQSVDIFLRAGRREDAGHALEVALSIPNIGSQLRPLVDYSTKIRQFDLCEKVLDLLLADTSMPRQDKVGLGIHFAHVCHRFGARGVAVRCLRSLWETCGDVTEELERLADAMFGIGENSMALAIRTKLARRDPKNMVRRLDMIEVQSKVKREDARQMIDEVLATPENNFRFWERISISLHQIGDTAGAIEATSKAMSLGADELASRRRLAGLYQFKKDMFGLKAELRKILLIPDLKPHVLRHCAELALSADDLELARASAQRQYDEAPGDPDAIVCMLRTLRLIGNTQEAVAKVLTICSETSEFDRTAPHLWLDIADEAARLGREDLELQLIKRGLSHHASDHPLLERHAEIESRQRVLGIVTKTEPTKTKTRKTRLAQFLKLK